MLIAVTRPHSALGYRLLAPEAFQVLAALT